MTLRMGFVDSWVDLVMRCITIVSYSLVLIEGLDLVSGPHVDFDKATL